MRRYIDIINESVAKATPEQLTQYIISMVENGASHSPYIAMVFGQPGDGSLTLVKSAVKEAGVEPRVISLGHSMVGKSLPEGMFDSGVVILDVAPHNLRMCLGARDYETMLLQIKSNGSCQIIIVQKGENQLAELNDRFPMITVETSFEPDIADGNIHRLT